MKAIIMNYVMEARFELQYKVVAGLQRNCFLPVSGLLGKGFTPCPKAITLQISMSIATMEEELEVCGTT